MNAAASTALRPVRLPVWRARIVLVVLLALFAVLAARSLHLQVFRTAFLQERGEARYSRALVLPATRGRIVDRNGEVLAVSTPVRSIWAIPEDVRADSVQRRALAGLLGLSVAELERRLAQARDFAYLRRQIPPETAERIAELRIPGIYQHREYRRYYPAGEVTAHLVGFTGVEDTGQEGVELAFEAQLAGMAGSRRVIKDRLGRVVEDIEAVRPARHGRDLRLAMDAKIQALAYAALRDAVSAHRARAGAVVVVDTRTGELLALANVPSYNPNNRAQLAGAQLRNRAVTDSFEPGSTMKPFTVALALEQGRVTPATALATGGGRLQIGGYTIRDVHAAGALTVTQVLQRSSNVGAAKLALTLPREDLHAFLRRLGFGEPPRLGFPGEAGGRLRQARSWRAIEQATIGYGHGIAASLVQLARAYTVFAREGDLVPLALLAVEGPVAGTPVIAPATARAVRQMLELAVQPGGTAPRARIEGWRVAGKTGTAHKAENGAYAADRYIASFVGLAPVTAPRLVVAVMIDEPSAGRHYGGEVAAPVFAQVMRGALHLLGVAHDAPVEPLPLPGLREAMGENT